MAYSGTTAASSASNPPVYTGGPLVRGTTAGPNPRGGAFWYYASADGSTVVSASGYFTDAVKLGMRVGDTIHGVYQSSLGSTTAYTYRLIITSLTTAGAAVCSTVQMSTG